MSSFQNNSTSQSNFISANMSVITAQQRKQQNTEWAFSTNSRNENGIVLCIPRVFKNITKRRVFACMCNTGWGEISHVDLINCGSYQKAFVHFVPNGWSYGSEPEAVLRRLQAGHEVVFTYDVNDKHPEGWFWKISISKALNPKFRPKRVRRRQTVDLSSKMCATASAFVPQQVQVVNDDMLLQRKHENQKQRSPRDDPIRARQLEHEAAIENAHDESDGEIEEDFGCMSEQAATYMEKQSQLKKA